MKISVIESPQNIVIKETPMPETGPDEVLVKLEGTGVCASISVAKILQPEKFITHFIDFPHINDAFKLLKTRPETFLKAIITYQ
jgi:threonine dehydrogenase-like Zn-dependent dehydrogenase